MKVKYNRVSSVSQSGKRYEHDTEKYDLVLLDRVSGLVPFFDRVKGSELKKLVEEGKVKELVVEEYSRLGRNTGNLINTLDWLEKHKVNVYIRNLGLYSRPNGEKNPIWKMMSSVMSSLYEMELENIRERTRVGRLIYVQNGGVLGRRTGTKERVIDFLQKPKSKKILEYLKRDYTIRDISKICEVSIGTIMKVKKLGLKSDKND